MFAPELDRYWSGSFSYPRSPALVADLRQSTTELAVDRAYLRDALAAIRARPAREIPLSLKKIWYGWWLDPTSAAARHPAYWVPWLATLLFFLIGVPHRLLRSKVADGVPLVILLVMTLSTLVFYAFPRGRLPMYPVVFAYSAYGALLAGRLLERARARILHLTPPPIPVSTEGPRASRR